MNEILYYIMGKPMIERILDKDMSVKTIDLEMMNADEDFRTAFETSDRLIREESFKLSHHEEELPSEETDNVGPSEKSQGDIIDSSEHEEVKDESNFGENIVNVNPSDSACFIN